MARIKTEVDDVCLDCPHYHHDPGRLSGPPEHCYPPEDECDEDWECPHYDDCDGPSYEACDGCDAECDDRYNEEDNDECASAEDA